MSAYKLSVENFSLSGGSKNTLNIDVRDPVVLVFFKQTGCGGCAAFEPIFSQLVHNQRNISYGVCDLAGKNREIINMSKRTQMAITSVPFIVIYVRGKPFAKFNGKRNIPSLSGFIEKVVSMIQQQQQSVQNYRAQHTSGKAPMGVPDEEEDSELLIPQNVIPRNRPWNADGNRSRYATLD